jgi:hypothetical protein
VSASNVSSSQKDVCFAPASAVATLEWRYDLRNYLRDILSWLPEMVTGKLSDADRKHGEG